MDVRVFVWFGIFVTGSFLVTVSAQTCTSIRDCKTCVMRGTVNTCLECNDRYAISNDSTGCCSKGCYTDDKGYHLCNVATGNCTFVGCLTGFYGLNCVPCPNLIENCDVCGSPQNQPGTLECIACATGFYTTTNKMRCCPLGCDSCNGTTCTSCKPSYFLYNAKCDTCGNNCKVPPDGSARCDPISGNCYLGCNAGWHGSKCDVRCNLSNCNTCTYNEPAKNLTCGTCNAGYYGPYCAPCNVNCRPSNTSGDPRVCSQDGTCLYDCQPGWRGNLCNIRCDAATNLTNCLECSRYDFTCSKCKPGFWGNQCQYSCNLNCVAFQGEKVCNITHGACEFGCLATYYKYDCSGSCPNCANDVCDRNTGDCLDKICDPGFYGLNCNSTCPPNCKRNLNNQLTCEVNIGNCTTGCIDGKFGPFCTQGCSVNCASSPTGTELGPICSQSDGTCQYKCKPGYYTPQCRSSCSSQCVDNTCDITQGTCLECAKPSPGYLCPDGTCPSPFYGLNCNASCHANCRNGICGRYNAVCASCVDDFWGQQCTAQCGNCNGNTCNQTNGACPNGCDDGYYTPDCTSPCKHTGCQTCNITSGECTTCKVAKWGTNCDANCSTQCLPDSQTGRINCDRFSAACAMSACRPGYYRRDCSGQCNAHCGQNLAGAKPCNIDTGVCDMAACETKWYGPQCSLACPVNCLNQNCNRTGACVEGCQTGYWGPMCELRCQPEKTCNDGTCDQRQGECLECLKTIPSPLCRTAACQPVKTWGVFCEFACPSNCADGTCSRVDGKCSSCLPGYYGDFCDKTCPNCVNNKCYQTDGVCVEGCKDGWYELQCMRQCTYTGCRNCDRATGECIACKTSLWGMNCSQQCSRNCAERNGVLTCNRFSSNCDAGVCKAGYYAANCNSTCSQYCQTTTCDIDAGTCTPCLNGWYGQKCDGQCSARCKNSNCTISQDQCREGCTDGYWGSRCENTCNGNCASKACNKDTAQCLYGCNGNLFYDLTCNQPCNGNCLEGTCNRTGYCIRGCKTGWFGDRCQFDCKAVSRCNDGSCSRITGLCDDCFTPSPGPNCPTAECPSGKRGNACNDSCTSSNCLYNQCGRYSDVCNACPTGYYGNLCDKRCSHCKAGTGCDQGTGVCTDGCTDGWYGSTCESQCNLVCGSCERQSGECITCAAGRWGPVCELICSSNCKDTEVALHMIYCEKPTGACREGACKVGYWRSDCTQVCSQNCLSDANNNRQCAYLDGACLNGCKDTYYGSNCNSRCSTRCKDQLCTGFADTCTISCADGYYGATCSGTCSTHCAGNGKCNTTSGACLSGCEIGYYGTRCDSPCKNTCVDGTCDSLGGCPDCLRSPIGPNCRVQVCTPGYYGPTCESKCPGQYCLNNQCQRQNGTCENGCLNGYYGAYCTEVCQCNAAGTDKCEQTKGQCICKLGRYGLLCDLTCNTGCIGFQCERDGTCTNGCTPGRYGPKCDQECSNCINQECSSAAGTCLSGCKAGFYGSQCKLPCKAECKACDLTTGACTACADNYYSLPACDKVCSSNCVQQGTGRTCSQSSGDCLSGCKPGFYSLNCSQTCGNCDSCNPNDGICQSCRPGWWGARCKDQCSSNCARGASSNARECGQNDGYCQYGCVSGYYGNTCEKTCLGVNCINNVCDRTSGSCVGGCQPYFYGTNCLATDRCDNCRNGLCHQITGFCTESCPASYYGNRCTDKCLSLCRDSTCDKSSGYCPDCQLSPKGSNCIIQDPVTAAPPVTPAPIMSVTERLSPGQIGGITAGVCAFVIIFVIVLVCCVNYKRQYDDAKTEIHLPSDVIERLSTHRSLHSTMSTNYPVARVVGDDEKDFVLF